MEQGMTGVDAAKKILGNAGKKLYTHEVHIRRTAEKGKYIIRHDLRDRNNNPPTDGQRGDKEYAVSNAQELMDHLSHHMGDIPDEDDA
jgi:hypothetical protein